MNDTHLAQTIRIEAATVDLADPILAVIVAAFEQYRDHLDPPSGVFRESSDQIRHKLEAGGGFVARAHDTMAGAVLYHPYPDYMYLGRLAVLPAYRGRQIARQLIAAVEQAARDRQLPCVQLGVRVQLTGNQRLFKSLGYVVTGAHAHEGYAEPTYLTMEKRLQ